MAKTNGNSIGRRAFLGASALAAGGVALPAFGQSAEEDVIEYRQGVSTTVRRNASSFRALDWRPYFSTLNRGAVLVDISSRALHYWNDDESIYKLYPTSVPMSEDLTRRGRTKIIRKVEGPDWRPTPSMLKRNPEWPAYVPPGPDNPMGTHALYLTWQYYRIHGTHDTRKIGRRSSNGCIGLYNEHIAELFSLTRSGTQVLLI